MASRRRYLFDAIASPNMLVVAEPARKRVKEVKLLYRSEGDPIGTARSTLP
jgi:hypothetical protein